MLFFISSCLIVSCLSSNWATLSSQIFIICVFSLYYLLNIFKFLPHLLLFTDLIFWTCTWKNLWITMLSYQFPFLPDIRRLLLRLSILPFIAEVFSYQSISLILQLQISLSGWTCFWCLGRVWWVGGFVFQCLACQKYIQIFPQGFCLGQIGTLTCYCSSLCYTKTRAQVQPLG